MGQGISGSVSIAGSTMAGRRGPGPYQREAEGQRHNPKFYEPGRRTGGARVPLTTEGGVSATEAAVVVMAAVVPSVPVQVEVPALPALCSRQKKTPCGAPAGVEEFFSVYPDGVPKTSLCIPSASSACRPTNVPIVQRIVTLYGSDSNTAAEGGGSSSNGGEGGGRTRSGSNVLWPQRNPRDPGVLQAVLGAGGGLDRVSASA